MLLADAVAATIRVLMYFFPQKAEQQQKQTRRQSDGLTT